MEMLTQVSEMQWLTHELSIGQELFTILHDLSFDMQEAHGREDREVSEQCQTILFETYAALGELLVRAAHAPGISADLERLRGKVYTSRSKLHTKMRERRYTFQRPATQLYRREEIV